MIARKPFRGSTTPEGWIIETRIQVNGRNVEPGTEFSVRGEAGRFRFIRQVTRADNGATWIDAIGGAKGCKAFRSFHADRIKTVHRLERTRENNV